MWPPPEGQEPTLAEKDLAIFAGGAITLGGIAVAVAAVMADPIVAGGLGAALALVTGGGLAIKKLRVRRMNKRIAAIDETDDPFAS